MKHLEDLKDVGLGCLLYIGGVVVLVKIIQWLVGMII